MKKINLFDYMFIVLYLTEINITKSKLDILLFLIDYKYASLYKETITNDEYVILPGHPVPNSVYKVIQLLVQKQYLNKNYIRKQNYETYTLKTNKKLNIDRLKLHIDTKKLTIIKTVTNTLRGQSIRCLSQIAYKMFPTNQWVKKQWGKLIDNNF